MIALSKNLFLSLLTAKNISKNKGIKKFQKNKLYKFNETYRFDF